LSITLDKDIEKCGATRLCYEDIFFRLVAFSLLCVNSGGHPAYQNFVVEMLRKYYPDPNAIARSTWDIIDRF
jgi:hypothetical protein